MLSYGMARPTCRWPSVRRRRLHFNRRVLNELNGCTTRLLLVARRILSFTISVSFLTNKLMSHGDASAILLCTTAATSLLGSDTQLPSRGCCPLSGYRHLSAWVPSMASSSNVRHRARVSFKFAHLTARRNVPDAHALVRRTGDDVVAIGRHSDRGNTVVVAEKLAYLAGLDVPDAPTAVARSPHDVAAVRRHANRRHRVPLQLPHFTARSDGPHAQGTVVGP